MTIDYVWQLMYYVNNGVNVTIVDADAGDIVLVDYDGKKIADGWRNLEVENFYIEPDGVVIEANVRRCSDCGNVLFEGYVVGGGMAYYCDDCLGNHFTNEEWMQACDEDDDTYWTDWY